MHACGKVIPFNYDQYGAGVLFMALQFAQPCALALAKEKKEKKSNCEGTCAIPWYTMFSTPYMISYS